jgi:hypothetical protein
MRPAALLCLLPVLLSHTTGTLKSPQWLDERRQIVLDRKVVLEFEAVQPRDNALLEASTLSFKDERAEQYRIKERLPDIDGSWALRLESNHSNTANQSRSVKTTPA